MSSVVLITGVSRHLGARLAAELAADSTIERVIGVDSITPRPADLAALGRTEFVRADIGNPLIARVLAQARVETVVHGAVVGSLRALGGRVALKENNLVGTMQLLAACQKSETVSRVVLNSTTAVYGSSRRDPAVFTEEMHAVGQPLGGFAHDAVEVEGYLRGFARRRPDIAVTVLRYATIVGPGLDSPLTRYLAMPLVPTSLGYDPRLQLLHDSDAVEVLRRATVAAHPGVFNVAADGVVLLSQAVRRAGGLAVPVPAPAISMVGTLVRNSGVVEFSAEQASFLSFGRVVDTTRLREQFGYTPRYTSAQALRQYLDGRPRAPRLPAVAARSADLLAARLRARVPRGAAAGVGTVAEG